MWNNFDKLLIEKLFIFCGEFYLRENIRQIFCNKIFCGKVFVLQIYLVAHHLGKKIGAVKNLYLVKETKFRLAKFRVDYTVPIRVDRNESEYVRIKYSMTHVYSQVQ